MRRSGTKLKNGKIVKENISFNISTESFNGSDSFAEYIETLNNIKNFINNLLKIDFDKSDIAILER